MASEACRMTVIVQELGKDLDSFDLVCHITFEDCCGAAHVRPSRDGPSAPRDASLGLRTCRLRHVHHLHVERNTARRARRLP